jgi:hypothetical protein
MENSEVLQKLENIEILLRATIEGMNDPKKRAKEAEILIQASKELKFYFEGDFGANLEREGFNREF